MILQKHTTISEHNSSFESKVTNNISRNCITLQTLKNAKQCHPNKLFNFYFA